MARALFSSGEVDFFTILLEADSGQGRPSLEFSEYDHAEGKEIGAGISRRMHSN